MLNNTFIVLFLTVLIGANSQIPLAWSNSSAACVTGCTTTAVEVAVGSLTGAFVDAPLAKWIWGSTNNVNACLQNNTFQNNITIVCPGQPLAVHVQSFNQSNFTLLGTSASQTNSRITYDYSVPTTGTTCGNLSYYLGQVVPFTIYASVAGPCFSKYPAGLRYAVVSPNCTIACAPNSFYDSSVCGCSLCTKYLPNCNSCTSAAVCTSCSDNRFLLISNACVACSVKIPYCTNCLSATVCVTCAAGYKLVKSTCR